MRRIMIGMAVLVTLVAALVTEENWRGKRAWDNYRREADSRGEWFDMAAIVPPSVADNQNFFCAPIVTNAFKNSAFFNIYRGDSKNWPATGGNWQKETLTDLKEWQDYFRKFSQTPEGKTNGFRVPAQTQSPAADILLALSIFNQALEEFRQASLRPQARMPLDYEKGFEVVGTWLPSLAAEKRWAQFLQLQILAESNAGQSQAALDDIKLFLRVIDSLRNQPYLISHLVRIAMQAIALQPIYEGLAQHRWDDAQLASLEATLAEKDYLADFQFAMRGERTCAIATFELQRSTREMKSSSEQNGAEILVTNSLRLMPSAYFYQNELAFARMYEQLVLPLVDLTNRTVSVAAYRTDEVDVTNMMRHYSPYTVQALMLFPAVGRSVQKFALIQSQVDLARVACALERYRLAHGEYPESLDALVPLFIEKVPHDIISGPPSQGSGAISQPLHYRRTDDSRFILYSVGWNEKDDGGVVVFRKGSSNVDPENGDWVWQYPAK